MPKKYFGFLQLLAWTSITESEYQKIKHKSGILLPTIVVSTLKDDKNNKPKHAKYRIFALGNLDPPNWNHQDAFAPVLSLLEVQLLAAISVHS